MELLKLFNKYIQLNEKLFKNNISNKDKEDEIVLVEFFDIKATIISFSFFISALTRDKNYRIIAYFPNFISFKRKIKFFFNKYLNILSSIKLFNSFGVSNYIFPQKKITKQLNQSYSEIMKKIHSKHDVLKIEIQGVHLGDLIYDTYLRENNLITINVKDKLFKNFIYKTLQLYYFWDNYFKNTKIKSMITSHSVYLTALPLRIAMKYKIDTFCVNYHSIFRLTVEKPLVWGNFDDYPNLFNDLSEKKKEIGMNLAKAQLQNRFSGKKDKLYEQSTPLKEGTFVKQKIEKNILKKNDNFKILIAAHDFNDAPHVHGNLIFADMYEWLEYLGQKSLIKKNYDWYIKLHPADYDENEKKIQTFLTKYQNFQLLPKNISHYQIIDEKINCVLTVFGSIGHEYPFFKIPVINAGHNPHSGYNFNYNPSNQEEYNNLFENIESLIVDKDYENEIYQFYLVRYFLDYNLFPEVKNSEDFNNVKTFQIFFSKFNDKHILKIIDDYHNFIQSKMRRLINTDQIY